jgi:hypothetical protein
MEVVTNLMAISGEESLNVSTRCDCNSKVCQIRQIVAFEKATYSAIERVLH